MDNFSGEKLPLSVSFGDFFFGGGLLVKLSQVGASRILLACQHFKESKWEEKIGDLNI